MIPTNKGSDHTGMIIRLPKHTNNHTVTLDQIVATYQAHTAQQITIVIPENSRVNLVDESRAQNCKTPPYTFILQPYAHLCYQYLPLPCRQEQLKIRHNFIAHRHSQLEYAAIFTGDLPDIEYFLHLTVHKYAAARIHGAYVAQNDHRIHIQTEQQHVGVHGQSSVKLKGVVANAATSQFLGTITVAPEAEHTDAHQEHKTILLSDQASSTSVPSLEVHTNEVRCGHGSATSQLDQEQLNYLQMRGIEAPAARQLLLEGFLAEFDIPKFNSTLKHQLATLSP